MSMWLATTVAERALRVFAQLTVAFAGASIGLIAVITLRYWFVLRHARNGARLLPAHVLLIGVSYAMLAVVGVVRLGNPPPPSEVSFTLWWIYPWISLAFLLGDVALVIILRFIARRGSRVGGRRSTDPPV